MTSVNNATVQWDFGTAYEFFISLHVLLKPELYGIRPSWAAGIRSRIPTPDRKLIEEVVPFLGWPIEWAYRLPAPKDAISAMWALRQIPAAERFDAMYGQCCDDNEYGKKLLDIAHRGTWDEKDIAWFHEQAKKHDKKEIKEEEFKRFLDWVTRPEEFGERYLSALQAYHQAFFENEEKRITPILKAGLERAQTLAKSLNVSDLIKELSQGIRLEEEVEAKEIVFAPLYWTTPLVVFEHIGKEKLIVLFGARPAEMSAIPGELVPDGLIRALKALADPTRLRILRYLSKEELTPSEIARRLNLRAPTVTHHLSDLRLCGLVYMTVRKTEKLYSARKEALDAVCVMLEGFLESE